MSKCSCDFYGTSSTTAPTTTTTQVAFLAGGFDGRSQLYSPSGKCNYELDALPGQFLYRPTLAYTGDNKNLVACFGQLLTSQFDCWNFEIQKNKWSPLSTKTEDTPGFAGGIAYEGKIYMISFNHQLVFDTVTNVWSTWPAPLLKTDAGCLVQWKDNFIYFGGFPSLQAVQKFNLQSQTWVTLESNSAPFDIVESDCLNLPNNKILVVSFYGQALYNPESNTWEVLASSGNIKLGTTLVTLSGRVFDLGTRIDSIGYPSHDTEEFDLITNTWLPVEYQLLGSGNLGLGSAISLPARLFEYLPGGCVGI